MLSLILFSVIIEELLRICISSSQIIILLIISLVTGTADWLAQWYPYFGESIDTNKIYSLFKLDPITGRKHQIRKHFSIIGHPIIGDFKYRSFKSNVDVKKRLMLHAYKISFSIDDIKYNFSADMPEDFKNILKKKYLKIVL